MGIKPVIQMFVCCLVKFCARFNSFEKNVSFSFDIRENSAYDLFGVKMLLTVKGEAKRTLKCYSFPLLRSKCKALSQNILRG